MWKMEIVRRRVVADIRAMMGRKWLEDDGEFEAEFRGSHI